MRALIVVKHGSGATVASRTAANHNHSENEVRGTLRNALTQMVLSGMQRGQDSAWSAGRRLSYAARNGSSTSRWRHLRAIGASRAMPPALVLAWGFVLRRKHTPE